MTDIDVIKARESRIDKIDWDNLQFGYYFSDHMYIADYKNGEWEEGKIIPYGPMEIEPANCTFHYSQTIFEGLKAFRSAKGGANIFRPDQNVARLNRSAERMVIPKYDEELLLDAIKKLVEIDNAWLPKKRGESLYIRPVVFGMTNLLKVKPAEEYRLIVMTSPVTSYYASGLNPVKILIEDKYVRAVRGGTGAVKTGGNYAASLKASKKAGEIGYAQVLWLDAVNKKFVNEVGAMNIMFVIDDELITPPLDEGTILPGVTRESALTLAEEWGMNVSVRDIGLDEILQAHKDGKLKEVFGTGTAAVISPVGELGYKGDSYVVNDMKIGPIAQKFYDTITGIQYGEIEDTHGWNVEVDF